MRKPLLYPYPHLNTFQASHFFNFLNTLVTLLQSTSTESPRDAKSQKHSHTFCTRWRAEVLLLWAGVAKTVLWPQEMAFNGFNLTPEQVHTREHLGLVYDPLLSPRCSPYRKVLFTPRTRTLLFLVIHVPCSCQWWRYGNNSSNGNTTSS
jgi:hypothetical protein